jgi:hypothetical protein
LQFIDFILRDVFELFIGGLGDDVGIVDSDRVGIDIAYVV